MQNTVGVSLNAKKPVDAHGILDALDQGIHFHCYYHAKLFCQCAEALGYPARIAGGRMLNIEQTSPDLHGNNGHEVAEVWSNTLRKWILIDCDMNAHYECNGIPMSLSEICNVSHGMIEERVELVLGDYRAEVDATCGEDGYVIGTKVQPDEITRMMKRFVKNDMLDYYALVLVANRHDMFANPQAQQMFVAYAPPPAFPPLYTDGAPFAESIRFTQSEYEMNWSVNETAISLRLCDADSYQPAWEWVEGFESPVESDVRRVRVTLTHTMPNFDHFEYRTDEENVLIACNQSHEWILHEGINRFEAVAVNTMGIYGCFANVTVELKWGD